MEQLLRKTRGEHIVPWLLAACFFLIPVSATLKSVALILSLFALLFTPAYRRYLPQVLKAPWAIITVALYAFIVIACLWSQASWSEIGLVLQKYLKLLYLPVLTLGFIHKPTRQLCINAFIAAMILTTILSMMKAYGWLQLNGDTDPGHIFHDHIITGFLVAYGAYLAALQAYRAPAPRMKFAYSLIALFLSYQVLFLNTGRTGYVVFAMLMVVFCLQVFSWKQAILAVLLSLGMMALVYHESPVMQQGIHYLVSDYQQYQHNQKNTSLGYRMQFHDYARGLFMAHPLAGLGTAGFVHRFYEDNPIPAWGRDLLEPHSQYWLIASEQGVIGLALFFLFLGSLLMMASYLPESGAIMWGFMIPFFAGNLSDSLVFYGGTGFVLIVVAALSMGEWLEIQLKKPAFALGGDYQGRGAWSGQPAGDSLP